jgi:sigma-E factor negative regulatory protein RseC
MNMSACGQCHAKAVCNAFEQQEKTVLVPNTGQAVQCGDKVNVAMKTSAGLKATLLAYILPLICVIAALLALLEAGVSELAAATASLATLLLYYVAIYFMRDKFQKQFSFIIEKAD